MNKKGFTLIEIMAAITIFVLVITILGSLYTLALRLYREAGSKNELSQNARVCLDRLSRELRQASRLITDVSATTSDIFFQDGHDNSEISYIWYYLDGTDMKRAQLYYYFSSDPSQYVYYNSMDEFGDPPKKGTTTDRIIGEYFSNMSYQGTAGLIHIEAELNKQSSAMTFVTDAYVRNY